jgi:MoaA/NifB/PqqE/SkfB family radical SAM enzyme
MLSKLKKYIDKELFVEHINNRLLSNNDFIVDSFISHKCNLKCNHCYFGDIQPFSEPVSLEKWEIVLKEAVNLGVKHFHFSGKESFLDDRIFPVLNFLSIEKDVNNLFYGVVSNGTSLSLGNYNEILSTNISYLEISIDGLKVFNDQIRGLGIYDKISKLIDGIEYKFKLNLTSTIFENNNVELISMIDFFRQKGINKFNFAPILYYSPSKLNPTKSLSYQSMLNFISKCFDYVDRNNDDESLNIRICTTKQIAYDLFCCDSFLKKQIDEYIFNGEKIIFQRNNKIVEISFPLLDIPFLNGIAITHDGYIISCADDIHYKNILDISLPDVNIINNTFEDVLQCRNNFVNQYIENSLN